MQKTPKVSVIISVYNVEKYLAECLDSVVNQTLKDIEIICVDDGSPDRSIVILNEYAARDERIKIIRQENKGLPAARNAGLRVASGDYVYFVDSDDIIKSDALEKLYAFALENQTDIVLFNADLLIDDHYTKYNANKFLRFQDYPNTLSGPHMFAAMQQHNEYYVPVWIQFYSKAFLTDNKLSFNESLRLYEDNLFSFECMCCAERVKYFNEVLYTYRIRAGSLIHTHDEIGFERYYSRYRIYVEMYRYVCQTGKTGNRYSCLWKYIYTCFDKVEADYDKLNEIEKKRYQELSTDEQILFGLTVLKSKEIGDRLNLRKAREENKKYRKEIHTLKGSASYKIGRQITFVPRMILKTIRCLRIHGFKYTAKKVMSCVSKARSD